MKLPKMNRAQRRLFDDICVFCKQHNHQHAVRRKEVAKSTTHTRFQHLVRALVVDLHHLGHRKEKLKRLKPRDVIALIRYWETRLGPRTIRNRLSTLRWLCAKLGKTDIVPADPRLYMADPVNYDAPAYARTDATPSGKDADVADFLRRVAEIDLLVALVQLLKIEWGLRRREAILTRPHEQDKGDYFVVTRRRGPKGGRPRVISHYDFRAEWNDETGELDIVDPRLDPVKRNILDLLKRFTNKQGSLIPQGYNLSRWMRWERTVVAEYCGLSMRRLGITSHNFRHEYAARRCEIVSGLARVSQRTEPLTSSEIEWDHVARQIAIGELGHRAKETMNFYAGQATERAPRGLAQNVDAALQGRLFEPIVRRAADGRIVGGSGLRVCYRKLPDPNEPLSFERNAEEDPTDRSTAEAV